MNRRLCVLLMILAAAVGLLVARVEYLHGYAEYHQREAMRFAQMIGLQRDVTPLEVDSALEVAAADPDDDRLDYKFHVVFHHRAAATVCQQGVYRPWMFVHIPPPPARQNEN